jgi:hypothetical protein
MPPPKAMLPVTVLPVTLQFVRVKSPKLLTPPPTPEGEVPFVIVRAEIVNTGSAVSRTVKTEKFVVAAGSRWTVELAAPRPVMLAIWEPMSGRAELSEMGMPLILGSKVIVLRVSVPAFACVMQ